MESEYMETQLPQFTDMERRVIVTLAEKGAMSGYDFHLGGRRERGIRKAMMSNSGWEKIKKSLGPEGQKIIQTFATRGRPQKGKLGRQKKAYWLTCRGAGAALLLNAKPSKVKENALRVNQNPKEREVIEVFFRMRESSSPRMAKVLDEFLFWRGQIEPKAFMKHLFIRSLEISKEEASSVFNAAKKESKYWELTKGVFKDIIAEIKDLIDNE